MLMLELVLFLLPFLRLVSGLTNVTVPFSDAHIIMTGAWVGGRDCGGATSTVNTSASLTFNGVGIYVLGNHHPFGGILQITLDGQSQSIDLVGNLTCGEVLFSKTGLANGQHSIKLVLTGGSPGVTREGSYPDGSFVLTSFIYTMLDPTDSATAVSKPSSTLLSGSVPTQTGVAFGRPADLSKVQKLWTCKPYGPNDCVFAPQAAAGLNTYSLIVGSPASNCGGGTENFVVTLGGKLIITDSWSQSLSVGLSLGSGDKGLGLQISGETTWGKTESREVSQTFQIIIPSQRKGALLAQVTYNSTNGTLQIGKDSPFPVVANQPQRDVIYVANVVPCDAQFNGNFSGAAGNSSSSGLCTNLYGHKVVFVQAVALMVLLLNL